MALTADGQIKILTLYFDPCRHLLARALGLKAMLIVMNKAAAMPSAIDDIIYFYNYSQEGYAHS